MEDKLVGNTVIESLQKYDKNKEINYNYLKDKVDINTRDAEITFMKNKKKFKYEVLGILAFNLNIWMWSWAMPLVNKEKTNISRKLLDYGLKIDFKTNDYFNRDLLSFLKNRLTNTRIKFTKFKELETHFAICKYLSKDLYKFIYPSKIYDFKGNLIKIDYLLIMEEIKSK